MPSLPVLGVGAVVIDDERRVVLVKRAHEPLRGQWSLPGGRVELGESLTEATAREVFEETGLVVDVGPMIEVVEHVTRDADGAVTHHFVIVDFLCRVTGGRLIAGSDATEVAAASPSALGEYGVSERAIGVVRRGVTMLSAS
jgi:ADP-ribose pyrophosphatase YjhB (NUDIX family)